MASEELSDSFDVQLQMVKNEKKVRTIIGELRMNLDLNLLSSEFLLYLSESLDDLSLRHEELIRFLNGFEDEIQDYPELVEKVEIQIDDLVCLINFLTILSVITPIIELPAYEDIEILEEKFKELFVVLNQTSYQRLEFLIEFLQLLQEVFELYANRNSFFEGFTHMFIRNRLYFLLRLLKLIWTYKYPFHDDDSIRKIEINRKRRILNKTDEMLVGIQNMTEALGLTNYFGLSSSLILFVKHVRNELNRFGKLREVESNSLDEAIVNLLLKCDEVEANFFVPYAKGKGIFTDNESENATSDPEM